MSNYVIMVCAISGCGTLLLTTSMLFTAVKTLKDITNAIVDFGNACYKNNKEIVDNTVKLVECVKILHEFYAKKDK